MFDGVDGIRKRRKSNVDRIGDDHRRHRRRERVVGEGELTLKQTKNNKLKKYFKIISFCIYII